MARGIRVTYFNRCPQCRPRSVGQFHMGGLGLESLGDIHNHDADSDDRFVDSDGVPAGQPVTRSTGSLGARPAQREVHDCLTSVKHPTIDGLKRRPELGDDVLDLSPEVLSDGASVDGGEVAVDTPETEVSVNKSESDRCRVHEGLEEGESFGAVPIDGIAEFWIEGEVRCEPDDRSEENTSELQS